MNFNAPLLKTLRMILFPVSLLYAAVVWMRNRFYDRGIIQSSTFNLPLICVGNLSVGGTGKSTMIEYLVRMAQGQFRLAILSRGYKRKTRGYALAGENSSALEIGDEPMQFYAKFPDVSIAVGEERVVALAQLLHDRPDTQAVLLDDAFQHRAVKAGLNIVLTEFGNLYTRDWYLPTGNLRDEKASARRAQVIVVTKCPTGLSQEQAEAIKAELKPLAGQHLFFAGLDYGSPYGIRNRKPEPLQGDWNILLVTGIANPAPLASYLRSRVAKVNTLSFGDHHIYTIDDWKKIQKQFAGLEGQRKLMVTTEKDAVRLAKFGAELETLPVYVLPVQMQILLDQEKTFSDIIVKFIEEYNLDRIPISP